MAEHTFPCGCKVQADTRTLSWYWDNWQWDRCPLHAAAEQMLRAHERIASITRENGEYDTLDMVGAIVIAQAAIAAAQPEKGEPQEEQTAFDRFLERADMPQD